MFRTSREGPLEEKAPAGQPAHRVHGGKAMTSLTKKMRLVSVGVAAVLTLGLVGTAAAVTSSRSTSSSSPQAPFHICANPYSVLKIMPKWTCPAGTVAVRLGSTGAGRNWCDRSYRRGGERLHREHDELRGFRPEHGLGHDH